MGEDSAEAATHTDAGEEVSPLSHVLISTGVVSPSGMVERVLHVFGKGDVAIFLDELMQKTF